MSSIGIFLVVFSLIWLGAFIIFLIFALRHAQTDLVQEIAGILSNTPPPSRGDSAAQTSQLPSLPQQAQLNRPATEQPHATATLPGPYQRKLALLGAYLDRHQREFVGIWELANGFLLQTIRPGTTETDYLKITSQQLRSLPATPTSQWEPQGPAVSLLQQIGAHLDQRQARTIQIVVVGQNVVAGGLVPRPAQQHSAPGQPWVTYVPFRQVFPIPEVA